MTARARIALGGAALLGPLLAFPTLTQPKLAIALCLGVVVVYLASRSIAFPLGLFTLPGVVIAVLGSNPFPNKSVEYFLIGWLGLAIVLALVAEDNVFPLRLIVSGPVLLTLGLAILLVARLGASTVPSYGSFKVQLFLAENISFLVAGILVARSRRNVSLWAGLTLATVAAGSLVLLQTLLAGGAKEVLPGRLALYSQADPILLARGAATGLLLAVFMLLAAPTAWRRAAALALVPVLAVSFIGAGSRGPVVGLVAGLFVLFALSLGDRASRRRLALLALALALSVAVVPQLVPGQNVSRSLSVLVGGGKDAGGADVSNGRYQIWSEAWSAFSDHPLTGIGTGSFANVDPVGIYPHNAFLEVAAELGLPGLLLLGGLIGLAFVHVGRAWRHSQGEDHQHAALVGAFLGAAVVNAQFSGDLPRNPHIWLASGLALGLVHRIVPTSPEQEPLHRLRTRWRRRGSGAPEPIEPNGTPRKLPPPLPRPPVSSPPPTPVHRRPAARVGGGAKITSPAPGSALRGEVAIACSADTAGRTIGSVVVEIARAGEEWVELGEATPDRDFDLFVSVPGGGRRHIAVLRTERRAQEMREALAGEHGVTVDRIEVRPAAQSRWAGHDARELLWDTREIEDGEYEIRAVTSDTTGRRIAGPEVAVRVDNDPPAVHLDSPRRGAVLMGMVDVAANARDAGSGIAIVRLECSAGDDEWTEIASVTAAPYRTSWNTGVLGEGDYRLRAIAIDRAGNEAITNPVPVRIERVVAAVKLDDPGACLARTVKLRAAVRDPSRVAGVEFQVAPAETFAWRALGAAADPPYELDFDTSRLEDGVYDLRAVVRDRAGGIDASRVLRARRVDNVAPSVTVFEPAAGALLRGGVPLSARASDHGSGVTPVVFQFSGNGLTWRPVVTRGETGGTVYWDTTRVADGSYGLRAVAGDAAGNLATSKPIEVRVDNTPPEVSLDEPERGAYLGGTIRLRASAADEGSGVIAVRFEWSHDGVAWGEVATATSAPYGVTWDTNGVADGAYRLRAVARDRAGNTAFGEPVELTVRNRLVFEPPASEPAAVEPATPVEAAPEPEPVPAEPVKASIEAATLWQLERLVEQRGASLEQREELEAILYTLRPYARPDGTIPERFWPLLWDAFGDLLGGG